jgi:D-glycero-D-manno-heptose 1,7-bisphosphate phosphatase
MVRLLFLDRDGTLNRIQGQRPPNRPDEVKLFPRVGEILQDYVNHGWKLIIVSNQGGVASGYMTEGQAHAIQQRVIDLLSVPIAASYLCPHMPNAAVAAYKLDCPNRKPKPGFLLTALHTFGARAGDCLFVGDSITDKEAAQSAGVPFQWADRFFERAIDRGLRTTDGQWVQIQEAARQDVGSLLELIDRAAMGTTTAVLQQVEETLRAWLESDEGEGMDPVQDLFLLARQDDVLVGWLALMRSRARRKQASADLALGVEGAYHDLEIDSLLMETGLEWASRQQGLRRLCMQVYIDNLPVSELCCSFGFVREGDQAAQGQDLVTMVCYQ